ncbi:MAG: tetratricopeptide repeat protein, partial [Deltaproteobacteria bacterium]|nr:tetratricopeptide repeat protein [Deltaproteobacteria bacterium]
LRRGLARAPDARWPSMAALLAALASDPAVARRRRRWFAGGLAATAAGGLAIVALARGGGEPDTFCRGGLERLAGTWDPARARVLRDTFVATGRGYAADTAARVTARLDAFAATWADARTEACVATRVRGEQSEAMLELRMQCLDRERVALGALVDVMTVRPDVDVLDHAVDATLALPPVAACADTAALQIAIPLPADPRNRAAIKQVRALLARASALDDVGKFPEGLAIVEATAAAAIALQYPQLTAEALIQRASLEERNGDAAAAEATIEQALLAAAAAHDDHLAAKLTSDLVFTVGYRLGRKQDAASLRHRLEVALRRAGDDRALAARAANSLGLMYTEIGEPTEARAQLERSIALWEAERGPDNAQVATAVNNLGNVYQDIGDFVAAKAYVGRGLAIRERVLGPDHPDTAMSADNLANAHSALGEYAESVRLHERALDVYTRALGPNSFDVALTRSNLAEALFAMGRIADARAQSEAALLAWEAAQGPDDPNLRYPLNNLAKALMAEGDLVGARRHVERSLALAEKRWGKGALRTTDSLRVLAQIEGAAGDLDGALGRFRVIVGIFDRADSSHHPDLVPVLTGLAETALLRAHPAEAAEAATRAIAIATERNLPAGVRARARFALARARWSTDQAQARALAALARDEYTTAGAPTAAQLAAVEAWLASRGP